MLIRLIRNQPQGAAFTGTLYVDSLITEEGLHQYQLSMHTLEHMDYAIPDGCYRLRMTYSPHFKEVLPILDHVFGYYSGGSESCRMVQSGVESCRMVQNGVESFSIENPMLHNSTQPLNNSTQPLHNATQPLNNSTQPLNNATQPLNNATPSAHRTGIRIHAGNTIEHTTGCILVGDISPLPLGRVGVGLCSSRKQLEELKNYLLNYIKQNPYEEIYIQLESPDPYPDYDTPCSYEQQQHIQESLGRARELRREEVME